MAIGVCVVDMYLLQSIFRNTIALCPYRETALHIVKTSSNVERLLI